MSLLDPMCEHETIGHKLARERMIWAERGHIAELCDSMSEYVNARNHVARLDKELATNLHAHRAECENE